MGLFPGGWIADLFGYKDALDSAATLYPRRGALRFLGAALADNATLGTTDVSIEGAVVAGSGAAGVHVYDPDSVSRVWIGSGASAGCIWRIGSTALRKTITFYTESNTAIAVQTPAGSTIVNIANTSGSVYQVTISFDGSAYNVVGRSIKP